MYKACFAGDNPERLHYTYASGRKEAVEALLPTHPEIINSENCADLMPELKDVEVIFSTWGMPAFSPRQIQDVFPSLKAVFYAAGSVQGFARPFLEAGIKVVSSWRAMAIPVAEMTVALITLANKNALAAMTRYKAGDFRAGKNIVEHIFPGTYGTRVGILGAGAIGSIVIRMLRNYNVELMVFDPFLSPKRMGELGLERTYSLDEIFSSCQTITSHLANNAQTAGMLNGKLFSLMSDTAAFINTARGAQVVEEDLAQALRDKPLRAAYLDVTWPEPMKEGHPFLTMPNVHVFPHIAGYARDEVLGLADSAIADCARILKGDPPRNAVTLEMLETMA